MRSKIRLVVGGLLCAAVGAAAASVFPVHAQPFRLRPSGSFRLIMTAGDVTLPTMVTFMSDGGIIGTTVPLSCLSAGESLGGMHGQWQVGLEQGLPVARFHLVSDMYRQAPLDPAAAGPSETSYGWSMEIFGTAPVSTGPIKGEATINIPSGPCAQRFNGPVSFTAFELPAVQKTPTDQ